MIIERYMFSNGQEVNSFLIACEETSQAMIIDAGGLDDKLLEDVKAGQLEALKLFISHDHHDHTEAVAKIFDLFPNIELNSFSYSFTDNGRKVADGEDMILGNLRGKFLHIPGHTQDMMALCIDGHIFTGDALFAGSVGGTSSEEDYIRQIEGIRRKLITYPDETRIHPGHGPDSSIGLEKSFNPFL